MKRVLLLVLAMTLIPTPVLSEEKEAWEKKEEKLKEEIHPKPKEYFIDIFLPHLWHGTKAVFSDEMVPYFALVSFSTGMAFSQDEKVRDYWLEHEPIGDWRELGNFWGEGYTQAGLALGLWTAGLVGKDQKLASTGEVLMEAEIINGLLTTAMKSLVGRERPDHSGNDSFPSGHTSDSFCFASVIADRYGYKWGIPAYALALFTGLSRMESDVHWLSDVIMGAGLGMMVGYSVSRAHDDWPYQTRWHRTEKKILDQAQIIPLISEEGTKEFGIALYLPLD